MNAAIADGLNEGEEIVLDLRSHLDLMELPALDLQKQVAGGSLAEQVEAQGGKFVPSSKEKGPAGGPGAGAGGPGGAAAGGPSGGAGGSGGVDPMAIVQRTFDEFDTDKNDKLSPEEIANMPEERRSRAGSADTNKDGTITKSEMTQQMQAVRKRMQQQQNGGGAPADQALLAAALQAVPVDRVVASAALNKGAC